MRYVSVLLSAWLIVGYAASAAGQPAAAPSPSAPRPDANPRQAFFIRFVPTGEERTIGFFTSLHPDCSVDDRVVVRITSKPEHGTAASEDAERFTFYPRENPRSACNEKKVRGAAVTYKSHDGYIGGDTFQILIIYPDGWATEATYTMLVR